MSSPTTAQAAGAAAGATVLGHPAGLFTLFFAEMWERFSFYGMRALLTLYMVKGFLAMDDDRAYAVYGSYGALVYASPFFGGMIADQLVGPRRAVLLGALLMAGGHLLMTLEHATAFYLALALLVVGNGFFKPNMSTMVGELYPAGSPRKDAGYTLFYMGINLGAGLAPLLCGYFGESEAWGWHYGFGLATVGMLVGTAIFVAPTRLTQVLVGSTAVVTAGTLVTVQSGWMLAVNAFLAVALLVAAGIAVLALHRGGVPAGLGAPAHPERLTKRLAGLGPWTWTWLGALAVVPVVALLLQHEPVTRGIVSAVGAIALAYLLREAWRAARVERDRLLVALALMFASIFFWALFEQAGSSLSNFTDRNVDRVADAVVVTEADVGREVELPLSSAQLGYPRAGRALSVTDLEQARKEGQAALSWTLGPEHVGMALEGEEVVASQLQSANPIFILLFGLPFAALWSWLGARGREPSEAVKFSLGLAQVGLGFVALWYGTTVADAQGMVGMHWLLLAYLLHTTGELCVSPVGLSMVTKLAPRRIVASVMGAWFLATSFSHLIAAAIAALTGVSGPSEDGVVRIPPPVETVGVYGGVFLQIGLLAVVAAAALLVVSPLLTRGMHREVTAPPEPAA
ncbi:MAG: peptide MFS transporter [Alphaproteobacteria bacterium]|nr:peptide MFS transporter [Alphaproteobacteria bacterium]